MYISSSIYIVNVRFNFVIQLCQRTPIAKCNRRIPYYAYYTCQSGSYVIETDCLETLYVF